MDKKMNGNTRKNCQRIAEILDQLAEVKPLYSELDLLITKLVRKKIKHFKSGGKSWKLRDNFAKGNTAFKATGIRRFEIVEDKRKKENL